jgi:hypothetical protein
MRGRPMGLKRYKETNAAYFVTSVTYKRKSLFNDRLAAELLLNKTRGRFVLFHMAFNQELNV